MELLRRRDAQPPKDVIIVEIGVVVRGLAEATMRRGRGLNWVEGETSISCRHNEEDN